MKTLIYIYGPGVNFEFNELMEKLRTDYNLTEISDEVDSKITFEGEKVSELVISKNLDYIKIDADNHIFQSLVFLFSQLLEKADSKHVYSFGLSGDPSDYNDLPFFRDESECEQYLFKNQITKK